MATISRTGIANASTIDASHITNIIDALDGTSATATIVASGSFSGSFRGNVGALNQDLALTGSLLVTSSVVTVASFGGNQNGYIEFALKNNNAGVSASTDIAAYSNVGSATSYYVDMGIMGSGYTAGAYDGIYVGKANDSYVYNDGGNMSVGCANNNTPSGSLFLFAHPNGVASGSGITITGSFVGVNKTGSINAAFDVNGNVLVTGSIRATAGITGSFTGSLVGNLSGTATTATTATTANTAPYLMQFTHATTSSLQAAAWYFANFGASPYNTINRIYVTAPIAGTIVSASIDTHSTILSGSAKITFQVVVNPSGTAVSSSLVGSVFTQPGAGYITTARAALIAPLNVAAGDTINIKYTSDTTTLSNLSLTNAVTLYFMP